MSGARRLGKNPSPRWDLMALTEINIVRRKQSMILHFSLQRFHVKTLAV